MNTDVLIVGGGAVGWSTAWHLLRSSPSLRVTLLDPDPSRCSSLRGAGGCRAQFASEVNIALSLRSIELLKSFAADVGHEISFRQHGYLLFTASLERAEAMQQLADYQRSHGVDVLEVGLEDLKRRVPFLNTRDLVYAQIGQQDGYFDGPEVQVGYRAAAERMGANTVQARVRMVEDGCVVADNGDFSAPTVVIATGHWSSKLGLPVQPEKHQLYFAEVRADPSLPFVIDADTTYHFRPDGDRLLTCYNDAALSGEAHDPDDPPTFEHSVLDRLLPLSDHRTPGLLTRENCRSGRAGFYGVTEDRHPLIGHWRGMVVCAGFGGHGVMHSPAAGLVASELVLHGESKSVDISSLSPDRFERGELVRETMVF